MYDGLFEHRYIEHDERRKRDKQTQEPELSWISSKTLAISNILEIACTYNVDILGIPYYLSLFNFKFAFHNIYTIMVHNNVVFTLSSFTHRSSFVVVVVFVVTLHRLYHSQWKFVVHPLLPLMQCQEPDQKIVWAP
jgi:hypothetical protein